MSPPAVCVDEVSHRYGNQPALDGVSFSVEQGEIFGLLGPNGGGKTTLFRILSTLLSIQNGSVRIFDCDVANQPDVIRHMIGVTFQSPSLDPKLTVYENLKHQSHLYGLCGKAMRNRIDNLLSRLGLTDRRSDRVESLSGGLKRRVEIAKGLLHNPRLLLLDEPSTGLDPGARHDVWRYLRQLRDESDVTTLVTTHLMEEAEHCDRLGILDRGQLVAVGTPDELRASVGGDCLTIQTEQADGLAQRIEDRFGVKPQHLGGSLRIEQEAGHELLRDLVAAFPDDITSVSLGKPTLEDVFITHTGHRFWDDESNEVSVS
jgi:ABC-2 type transport system ATP-binding protein